jgi:F0F1-type ATP synthase assembly protein I
MTDHQPQSSSYSPWKLSGLGMEVLSAILAGALFGYFFDRWRGTKPTGLAVGMIVGLIIGMVDLMRKALKASRDATADYKARHVVSDQDQDSEESSDG